jgi:hypothetical protein
MNASATPRIPVAFRGEIGVARTDITPPLAIYARSWGAAEHDTAVGLHRPLTATALALSSGNSLPLILITADLGWWKNSEDEWFVRSAVLDALGFTAAQLVMALTHTHAGPGLTRDDADKPGGHLIGPYLETLRACFISVARQALAARRPARMSWRYGRCDLACNRDVPADDGHRFLVGFNPDIPGDDTVLVGRVEEIQGGATLAVLVNYACHPTTLAWNNKLLSPDFPGAMRELVESTTHAPCLFLQGASGDLAPAQQYVADAAIADAHGRRLGYGVLATIAAWSQAQLVAADVVESGAPLIRHRVDEPMESSTLRHISTPVDLPLKPQPSLQEIDEQLGRCEDRVQRERLWRRRSLCRALGGKTTAAVPVWVWQLGDMLLVAQPNEAYSEFQKALRRRHPGRPVAVLNIANGYFGYLPPHDHYSRDQYSVWQTPFSVGALEVLTEQTDAIIEALSRHP